jgi:hypothetical protein
MSFTLTLDRMYGHHHPDHLRMSLAVTTPAKLAEPLAGGGLGN